MSSSIARSMIAMAAAAAIVLLGGGAIGSADARPAAARFTGPEGLTNRYEPPLSEIDVLRADY